MVTINSIIRSRPFVVPLNMIMYDKLTIIDKIKHFIISTFLGFILMVCLIAKFEESQNENEPIIPIKVIIKEL